MISDHDPRRVVAACRAVGRRHVTRGEVVDALIDVDVEFRSGTLTVVAGRSGSGKSTLLSLVGCLDRPTSGQVWLNDEEIHALSRRRRRVLRRGTVAALLPQPADNLALHLTGWDNLLLAARHRRRSTPDPDRVVAALGLGAVVERAASEMSGGEQQRVALGGAMLGECPVLVADEPTGALDRRSASDVVAALLTAAATGVAVIAASHDPDLVDAAHEVVWLDHGRRTS